MDLSSIETQTIKEEPIVYDKQRHLNDFREKLIKVYSEKCTLKAISELAVAYDFVKAYPERFDTIYKVTQYRPSEMTQQHWIKESFIPKQKK